MSLRAARTAGPQSLSVKRAEVEFHNFASLGEPERAIAVYAEENRRRGAILRKHLDFVGPISPFLEIGANAGHSSYMLANEFGGHGFASDISSDALRHGMVLMDRWGVERAPVRIAADALHLPFRDGSLRMVTAFQMLSQFLDVEPVFAEVCRVLAPGGIFFFAEEPLRRVLSLRLYRAPYYEVMKPWERKLSDWGLLGFLAKDVIGAQQEESFGIRQNHTMGLTDWDAMVNRHFAARKYEIFVRETGWGERVMKRLAVRTDPYRSHWRAARLLGGTLAAFCRKAGDAAPPSDEPRDLIPLLRCPDCRADIARDDADALHCAACGYTAPNEGGVYNLLPSAMRAELYPGDREDVIDFCLPSHSERLLEGWYDLEGVFGNRYRWIGARASARLKRVRTGPLKLRIRGHAHQMSFEHGKPATVAVAANGRTLSETVLERPGLFIVETELPDAEQYLVEVSCAPVWNAPPDLRSLTVSLSMLRLVPRDG